MDLSVQLRFAKTDPPKFIHTLLLLIQLVLLSYWMQVSKILMQISLLVHKKLTILINAFYAKTPTAVISAWGEDDSTCCV